MNLSLTGSLDNIPYTENHTSKQGPRFLDILVSDDYTKFISGIEYHRLDPMWSRYELVWNAVTQWNSLLSRWQAVNMHKCSL